MDERVEKIKINATQHRILNTSEEFHVDFQGGDWRVVIQIKDSSRNDPVVQVERTGPNSALIHVSSTVISKFDEKAEFFPDVVMALASSALAWEIAVQSDAVLEEKFNFESAVRDIYLSLSVSSPKKG